MEKVREVVFYCMVFMFVLTALYNYWSMWSDAKADEEIRKMVEKWMEEGPPSTILGKMRSYLPWWQLVDPIKQCGVQVDPADSGWMAYMISLHGAKDRLHCLKNHIHQAEQDHLEFTKMITGTLMVLGGVVCLGFISWAIKVYLDNLFKVNMDSTTTPLAEQNQDNLLLTEDLPNKEHLQEEVEEQQTTKGCVNQTAVVKHTLTPYSRKCQMDTVNIGQLSHTVSVSPCELTVLGNHGLPSGTRWDQTPFNPMFVPSSCRSVYPPYQQVTLLRKETHLRCISKLLISEVTYRSKQNKSIRYIKQQQDNDDDDDAVNEISSPVATSASRRGIQSHVSTQGVTRQQVVALLRLAGRFVVDYIIEGTHPRYW